tara:strand:+ start:4283 stop:5374 length:1092 start_codon:yes stop_codon:yes gene_type:complete
MDNKKKIALIGYRLNKGGAERVMATLSNFFFEKGFEVHIIIFHDELGYAYSGTVFNLGKFKTKTNSIINKIKRFYYFNKYMKQFEFDFIIDFRFRINIIQEILINKYIYKAKTIYTIHSSKIDNYLPRATSLTRFIYGHTYAMVSISKTMKKLVEETHQLKNVKTIYNAVDVTLIKSKAVELINLNFDFIIGVGQYDTNVKQFDKLIKAYAKSELPQKNIALVILGDGKLRNSLLNIINDYKINHLVHLLGFVCNPYKYISKSKYFVLTSKFEGFPMVLIEALACETPVIAFDCPTGPKEIIQQEINGLLIEDQNMDKLIQAMNVMLSNDVLYSRCKMNAKISIDKFSLSVIGGQWLDLMSYN